MVAFTTWSAEPWYPANVQVCTLEKSWSTFYSTDQAAKKSTMLNYNIGGTVGAAVNIVGTIAPRFYCDAISNSIMYSDTQLNWLNAALTNQVAPFIAWGWGYSTADTATK